MTNQPPDWEDIVDQKLNNLTDALTEVNSRLMSLENSHTNLITTTEHVVNQTTNLVDLFQKLWEGFQTFKDSPMLRMFAGGILGGKKSVSPQGSITGNNIT